MIRRFLSLTLLVSLLAHTPAWAQETIATIEGRSLNPVNLVVLLKSLKLLSEDGSWHDKSQLVIIDAKGSIELIGLLRQLDSQATSRGGDVHLVLGEKDFSILERDINDENTRWLQTQKLVLQLGETVFASGGISRRASDYDSASLNERIADERVQLPKLKGDLLTHNIDLRQIPFEEAYDKYVGKRRFRAESDLLESLDDILLMHKDAPHQYLGSAVCHPYSESFNVERFLKRTDASRLIIQSADSQGTTNRMNGLVVTLNSRDTSSPEAVLFIRGEQVTTRDGDHPKDETRSISQTLSGMSDEELERYFLNAKVVSTKDIGTGITKPIRVTQTMNNITQDSVFKYVDSDEDLEKTKRYRVTHNDADRYGYEVAAYRIDRLLDLQMIPTATKAEVKGKPGVLQDWATGAINERDRIEENIAFDSHCKKNEQYQLRFVFDILIHNDDRNLTNILWNKNGFMLWFIDHTRAFRSSTSRPEQLRRVKLRVSDLFTNKLEALNYHQLLNETSDFLHPTQIEAMLKRRDLILKERINTDSVN